MEGRNPGLQNLKNVFGGKQLKKNGDKIRIAFYLNNKNIAGRNLYNVEEGNPGIGGSQYMQLLTASCLAKDYDDIDIIMYATEKQRLPEGIKLKQAEDIRHALSAMKQDGCDVFVMSNWYEDTGDGIETLKLIEKYKMKTIIWAHVFMNHEQYRFIASCKYIRLFVCLGKQQLEMLRGSRLYKKATYINYILPPVHSLRQENDKKIIAYVGAIYPFKGFHILAKYWKYIKKNVEDVQLWVLGSGRLYGDNVSLGKYEVAEAEYEKQFIHYLLDSNGEIDRNVKFFGSIGGSEKEKIVSQATVGIFNPSGLTETFGLSGVEFEAMGIPVVSIYKNSAPDIIKHKKTGLLYRKEKDFPEYIIRLLKDKEYNRTLGEHGRIFVTGEFDRKKIAEEWHDTIISIAGSKPYLLKHEKKIMLDNQIWLHHMDNYFRENTEFKKFIWESGLNTGW